MEPAPALEPVPVLVPVQALLMRYKDRQFLHVILSPRLRHPQLVGETYKRPPNVLLFPQHRNLLDVDCETFACLEAKARHRTGKTPQENSELKDTPLPPHLKTSASQAYVSDFSRRWFWPKADPQPRINLYGSKPKLTLRIPIPAQCVKNSLQTRGDNSVTTLTRLRSTVRLSRVARGPPRQGTRPTIFCAL